MEMNEKETNEIKIHRYIRMLKVFFRIMRVRPYHIILPMILSSAVALMAGISIGLLIPVVRGLASGSFGSVWKIPVFRRILYLFPDIFIHSTSHNRSIFILCISLVFVAIVLKNVIGYLNELLYSYWNRTFSVNMYKFTFKRVLSFGKLFFDRTNQGYIGKILSYSSHILNLLDFFQKIVLNILTLSVYFVIMFVISWRLSLIMVLLLPILHYSTKWLIKQLIEISYLINNVEIEISEKVFNILSCMPLVKAYSQEKKTEKVYSDLLERKKRLALGSDKITKSTGHIDDIIASAVLLMMIAVAAIFLVKDKPAELATFVIFIVAARRTTPLFKVINQFKETVAKTKPRLKRLLEFMEDEEKHFVVEGKNVFSGLQSKIEFKNATFSYIKGINVLKEVSLTIKKGKMTALVGPSGAGKTTIINLLLRLYDCAPSSIFVDDTDIQNFTLKSLRDHMAFVSQETLLFNDTLRANITYGQERDVSEKELIDVAKKARIYNFIKSLPEGFDTFIGDRGIRLSGGEKQRTSIARALLKKTEILFLDEATSSLDSRTERLIQEAIEEVVKDRTSVIIAHRLSTIKNADKIIVIEEGRILESGSLKELLGKKGKFYQYWEEQKFY